MDNYDIYTNVYRVNARVGGHKKVVQLEYRANGGSEDNVPIKVLAALGRAGK